VVNHTQLQDLLYISPPRDFSEFFRDPFHSFFYICFVCLTCGFFAKYWLYISGESAKDLAKKIKDE